MLNANALKNVVMLLAALVALLVAFQAPYWTLQLYLAALILIAIRLRARTVLALATIAQAAVLITLLVPVISK